MRPIGNLFVGLMLAAVSWSFNPSSATAAEDSRELIELPPMMQRHMLANMRDHLLALDEILGELAEGNIEQATEIAEKRLGMSSLSLHGAEQLGVVMPKAMGAIGAQMHRAASRFVIVAQDAELNPGKTSQHEVYKALQGITENCNACHRAYRIR